MYRKHSTAGNVLRKMEIFCPVSSWTVLMELGDVLSIAARPSKSGHSSTRSRAFRRKSSGRLPQSHNPVNRVVRESPKEDTTMARTGTSAARKSRAASSNAKALESPFRFSKPERDGKTSDYHLLRPGIICDTEARGRKMPGGRSLLEIVLDASDGFIPLWEKDVTLQWRFQERSLEVFEDPAAAKAEIETLLGEALAKWGDAAPVRFTKEQDAWDFEIAVRPADNCNAVGCVLASAFFPGSGQQRLFIYPKMFAQSRKEQVDTLIHEIGHTFGLRHFFADVQETAFPSVKFGTHSPFSIMNYGELSELTAADTSDLKRLYEKVWGGELTKINGTPIRLMKPFHTSGSPPDALVAAGKLRIH
jgi:hypothetical protein